MIDALLTEIKDYILAQNPNTFQNGYSGARQYQDGKVVIYNNYEGTGFGGLTDSHANYFYIRWLENSEYDVAGDNRTTSCNELNATTNLRLVAWVKNGDPGRLEEVLLTDLMGVDFNDLAADDKKRFSNIKMVTPFEVLGNFEQVYKEETLAEDEDVKMRDDITLMAVDFALNYNYSGTCLNRQVCV